VKHYNFLLVLCVVVGVLSACRSGPPTGPLAAPSSLSAVAGSGQIELSWQDNSTAEEGFRIYRRLEAETEFIRLDFVTPVDAETFLDTAVSSADTYVYQVRAFAGEEEGPPSSESTPVKATLGENKATLSITRLGIGQGVITSNPAGINCINRTQQNPGICSFDFDIGDTVTLTATPDAGSQFIAWGGDCTGTTCSVTLDSAKTVTATFGSISNELRVTKEGDGSGTITSRNGQIECGTVCNFPSEVETLFRLSAIEDAGSVFKEWRNCDTVEDSTTSNDRCVVTIGGPSSKGAQVIGVFLRNVGPPTIDSLTAAPNPMSPSTTQVTLSWGVDDKGTSELTPLELTDNSPNVTSPSLAQSDLNDSVTVQIPTSVTSVTFTLTARNFFTGAQGVSRTVTVTRGSSAAIGNFSAQPEILPPSGGSVTLSWSGVIGVDTEAATLVIERSPGTPINVKGDPDSRIEIPNQTVNTTYTLVADNEFSDPVRSTSRTVSIGVLPTVTLNEPAPPSLPAGGGDVTLTWSDENATKLTLERSPGTSIDLTLDTDNSETITQTETTTYTLVAENQFASGASAIRSEPRTVTVEATPPTLPDATFTITPPTDTSGSYTLNWSATGTPPITFTLQENTGTPENVNALNGKKPVKPTTTTTYTLDATNVAGSDPSPPSPITITAPTAILTANPTSTTGAESVTLDWSTSTGTGPATFTLNTSIDGGTTFTPESVSGTSTTRTPTVDTIYTITMTTPVGTVTSSQVPVTVTPPVQAPTIRSFNASPTEITRGSSSTLEWDVIGTGLTVEIDNAVGVVAPQGSQPVSPGSSTTYTLTATNEGGRRTANARVVVSDPPPPPDPPVINSFAASPGEIVTGESSTLTWDVSGEGLSVEIDNAIGAVPPQSSTSVSPPDDTTYTLTASNGGGTVTATAIVVVNDPPAPPVISSFTADPITIDLGNSSTLAWEVTGTPPLTISLFENGVLLAEGSEGTGNFSVNPTSEGVYTYTLTAGNEAGDDSATREVTVLLPSDDVNSNEG
jgi:hypothetical protein